MIYIFKEIIINYKIVYFNIKLDGMFGFNY